MTRKEAINFGHIWLEMNEDVKESRTYEFFKIAINILEQYLDEDAISRQAVKDALYNAIRIRELNYRQIVECIDELPSVAPVEIEPKLFINTDEVVKKLCNIIIQRESKEYYSIKITANERCENVIADIGHSDKVIVLDGEVKE